MPDYSKRQFCHGVLLVASLLSFANQAIANENSDNIPEYGTQAYAERLLECSLLFKKLDAKQHSLFMFSRLVPLIEKHRNISVPNGKLLGPKLEKYAENLKSSFPNNSLSAREAFAYIMGDFDCVTLWATEALTGGLADLSKIKNKQYTESGSAKSNPSDRLANYATCAVTLRALGHKSASEKYQKKGFELAARAKEKQDSNVDFASMLKSTQDLWKKFSASAKRIYVSKACPN